MVANLTNLLATLLISVTVDMKPKSPYGLFLWQLISNDSLILLKLLQWF
ncbi:hypothetical protein PTUN_a0237 [Pseudoalteromonas tunicata]|uniref:Uncharacterized protein n=1 Tax=Pseudoalteromonas tunicata D2 TaxID=87626 RepID=A4CE93_9GAMM|nr:hypothetical protein PTUN_a0237 [Pseudoalteromonas tunicata]EAR26905.1 hypothetical protein PTD2_10003 [Pseudoalteromonas tunicata D2]